METTCCFCRADSELSSASAAFGRPGESSTVGEGGMSKIEVVLVEVVFFFVVSFPRHSVWQILCARTASGHSDADCSTVVFIRSKMKEL